MDSSTPSPSSSGQRRGHLKRLSLSVGAGAGAGGGSPVHDMLHSSASSTPDRVQYAAAASPSPSSSSMSPLHRSLGSTGQQRRRQRPMSMHAGPTSPLSAGHTSLAALDAALLPSTPASSSSIASTSTTAATPDQLQQHSIITSSGNDDSNDSIAHPLAAASSSPHDSSITSPSGSANALRNSTGRRSILGRSAHARRQSSISYARSPSNDSPSHHSIGNTSLGTPRTSLSAIRDEDEENVDASQQQGGSTVVGASPMAQTPSKTSIDRSRADSIGAHSISDTMSQNSLMGTSPSSINEMSIGPGARSSDLLTFIAKKERKCLDLREELQRQESELAALKKKWEMVIQREMQASTASAAASSNMSPSHSQTGTASSLFSSLTSTLNASTSSSSLSSSHTASGSTAAQNVGSPSPGNGSRRLLTNRHSISVASPSSSLSYFGGGADLSPQTSPLSALNNAQQGGNVAPSLDVQKIAKSWLGGVMKSASNVLEGLAPPPPTDLGTVAEEEEPEDGEEEYENHRATGRERSSAGHPSKSSPHNRKESTATNNTSTSEMSSPSSSCEDGQFSSGVASRSSSVSSLHSDNGGTGKDDERGDTTPIATPVLPEYREQGNGSNGTPRATATVNGDEEKDLWALSGDFEDDSAREKREHMERNRIDVATGSPVRETTSSSKSSRPSAAANHGRRRSTAFELGGAWGAMVGKKWNEMASQLSANETLKASSKKAMGLMEGFERSLNEAITPDPNERQSEGNTHLMLVNGELIPTSDWSPASSPQQRSSSQGHLSHSPSNRQNDLPSGIGGPATWSALLGRTKSNNAPKSPQAEYTWGSGGMEEKSISPSFSNSGRPSSKSLLDDDNDESSPSSYPLNVSSPASSSRRALSPTPLTAQERIQASRAKHAKRMSMPLNMLSNNSNTRPESPAVAKKDTFGLGLEGVNENEEEDEGAWGW